ncbi:hypothetical protein ACHAXT_011121 [Thalassiosira profunda]
MQRILQGCSPHHHPRRWLVVNCAVLLWSLVLLARILALPQTHDADEERSKTGCGVQLPGLQLCHVCRVAGRSAIQRPRPQRLLRCWGGGGGEESLLRPTPKTERTKNEVVALWVELVLAAYFFIDSTTVAVHLSRRQIHRQARGMTIDIAGTLAAYLYLVYRQAVEWKRSRQDDGGRRERSCNSR